MTDRFDLIDGAWIPCERLDGSRVELGVADVLRQAHELRAVCDASPLVTAALHRLLLAVLHRCFGPPDVDGWVKLYEAGRFDVETLSSYLEQWRDRFDLFHPDRPFYQVRDLPFGPDPVDMLVTERTSWGGGVHLFQHRPEGVGASLNPAEAARWLVTALAFAPGGFVRKHGEPTSASAGPLNRGAVLLVRGNVLLETLLSNLLIYSPTEAEPIPGSDDDAPAWEQEPLPRTLPAAREPTRSAKGWLDVLTWQSRRLELAVEGGRVVGCVRCVGQGLDRGSWLDPMLAWRLDKKRGPIPVGFDVERAFWRDSHALFRSARPEPEYRRPKALDQIARPEVRQLVGDERRFELDLLGLRGDQAKILLVRAESVPVSPRILADLDAGESICEVLEIADLAAKALQNALFNLASRALAPADRDADKNDVRELIRSLGAEPVFWSRAKHHFDVFLRTVLEAEAEARLDFGQALYTEARRAFEEASRALGATARVLKGAAIGEATLARKLAAISHPVRREATP